MLVSLLAEPITGVVDTAFVKALGASQLAALGVGTTLLSGVFWIFNFLGVGTQTEVAHAWGEGRPARAAEVCALALGMGLALGGALAAIGWPLVPAAARFMGAEGEVFGAAETYLSIRLLGGPAVVGMMAAFGALRGLQDMKTPLAIAVVSNALNVALDALLIFGLGPMPALGVAGAAWAAVASQWLAFAWAARAALRRLARPAGLRLRDAGALFVVGRDLFLRTGLLIAFIVLCTRAATRIGTDAGAAHQAIRQVWLLTALLLDAYAATAQSLVGYFLGARRAALARRAAAVATAWAIATGFALAVTMWVLEDAVCALLVPDSAAAVFGAAWWVAALAQPLNALSFVTDGIHWGARDYRYLRNAMFAATGLGVLGIALLDESSAGALTRVWWVTALWIAVRTLFGTLRVWPGIGAAPLRSVQEVAAAGREVEGADTHARRERRRPT